MKDIVEKIAEQKIKEAMAKGEFENLSGSGKPLNLDDDRNIPAHIRTAYRLLKNAGFIPPEVEERRELANLHSLIRGMEDDEERAKKEKELNYRLLKFNMTRKSPLVLERLPEYEEKLSERLLGGA